MADRRMTPGAAPRPHSALGEAVSPGDFGNLAMGPGVTLAERQALGICEVATWDGASERVAKAIGQATGLGLAEGRAGHGRLGQAFRTAPDRWLVAAPDPSLASSLGQSLADTASVIDLSHGLVPLRLSGERSVWVLSKLLPLDFDAPQLAPPAGTASQCRSIRLRLQRHAEDGFDLFVPRASARAFWAALTEASAEVGYRVIR